MPSGVDGLERPPDIPVEASFNEFVKEVGGQLVSEIIVDKSKQPQNADYYFPDVNVIVELKCFEKDLFNCVEDVERIGRIIQKHSESGVVPGYIGFRWVVGQVPAPREYRRDMLSLARRSIENAVRRANKQIKQTKELLSAPNARGLVILANDGNYFSHPAEAFALICQVMAEHFMESAIDGVVYFTVNVVARDPRSDRELTLWSPAYRKEGDELGNFVNQLGSDWHAFYSRKIGQDYLGFKSNDYRALKLMRFFKPPKAP